jgi:hypothetical protein
LGVGAPKDGATSFHDMLLNHPQMFFPSDKELHIFDNSCQFSSNARVKGEGTPTYMSPERILKTIGKNVKLIFMFREPVVRAFSEYQHNSRRGLLDEPTFEQPLEKERKRKGSEPFDKRYFSFIQRGKDTDQVEEFLKFFSKEQMLFNRFKEAFIDNKRRCIAEVLEFLGVGEYQLEIHKKSNASFVPQSRLVARILQKDYPLRKIARSLISNRPLLKSVRAFVNKTNSKYELREMQEKHNPNEKKLELLIGKPLLSFNFAKEIVYNG